MPRSKTTPSQARLEEAFPGKGAYAARWMAHETFCTRWDCRADRLYGEGL